MVKVEIEDREAQTVIELINNANVSTERGYILTILKFKILEAFKTAAEKTGKEEKKVKE
jgi:hypothetical protein